MRKNTRQTVEIVAQTIFRIDCTKLRVAEQGNAAEPEDEWLKGRPARAALTLSSK